MNNTILAARKPSPLVRVWRSTGTPGTPLICCWVQDEAEKVHLNLAKSPSGRGGLFLCI